MEENNAICKTCKFKDSCNKIDLFIDDNIHFMWCNKYEITDKELEVK